MFFPLLKKDDLYFTPLSSSWLDLYWNVYECLNFALKKLRMLSSAKISKLEWHHGEMKINISSVCTVTMILIKIMILIQEDSLKDTVTKMETKLLVISAAIMKNITMVWKTKVECFGKINIISILHVETSTNGILKFSLLFLLLPLKWISLVIYSMFALTCKTVRAVFSIISLWSLIPLLHLAYYMEIFLILPIFWPISISFLETLSFHSLCVKKWEGMNILQIF